MFTINGKNVDTFTDESLIESLSAKWLLKDGPLGFSLADLSSEPFAWMVEGGVEPSEIDDASKYVRSFVERDCNIYNYSSLGDDDLTDAIMELGLADDAVSYIAKWKQS